MCKCLVFSVFYASVGLFQIRQNTCRFVIQYATANKAEECLGAVSTEAGTFYAAAAGLQHPGVHVGFGMGEKLIPSQVRVMRRGDEVVTQRLIHVLIYLMVRGVENVTRRTAHEACKPCQ